MKSFVSFQKPFMGKEKARGHSAILLVIWSFPYLCLANTKFLWIVWQTPGGWMDLLSGTGVAKLMSHGLTNFTRSSRPRS